MQVPLRQHMTEEDLVIELADQMVRSRPIAAFLNMKDFLIAFDIGLFQDPRQFRRLGRLYGRDAG